MKIESLQKIRSDLIQQHSLILKDLSILNLIFLRALSKSLIKNETSIQIADLNKILFPYPSEAMEFDDYLKIESKIAGQIQQVLEEQPLLNRLINCGYLFQQWLSLSAERSNNKSGSFYTPLVVADYMVKQALAARGQTSGTIRVLDPASGGGIFSLIILEQLAKQGFALSEITKNIKVVDISAYACNLSYLCLAIYSAQLYKIPFTTAFACFKACCVNSDFLNSDAVLNDQFDLIIGNPPYGLARDNQISKEEALRLKERFAYLISGKPNKYLAFMARASELLATDGILSFITPNSWLGISSAEKLRKQWLISGKLKSITSYDTKAFPDLGVETVSFIYKNQASVDKLEIKQAILQDSISTKLLGLVANQDITDQPSSVIQLSWSSEAKKLLDYIDTVSQTLNSETLPFIPKIALQAYAEGKGQPPQSKEDVENRIYDSKVPGKDYYPYLIGKDIERFRISWSGDYLKHGNWLAEPQELSRFKGPRVVIREILKRAPYLIVAAYTDQTFLYNKSALHVLLKPNTPASFAKALTVLLNSKLISFILQLRGRKVSRNQFPKLLASDLKSLPVANKFMENIQQLSNLHDKIANNLNLAEYNEQLDNLVFDLYNLKNSQTTIVNQWHCGR